MLSRIPVHRLTLTCRILIAPQPIINRYFAPTCSHRRLLSDSPPAATAAAEDRRHWVMLSSRDGCRYRPDGSSLAANANTVAESRTSEGRRLRVSFRCTTPPSSSSNLYLYYHFPDSAPDWEGDDRIRVVAANGELVLLKMHNSQTCSVEHFVYRAAGARLPPSLSLLPVPDFPASYYDPSLDDGGIGLLRRGENDLLVVHVDLWYDCDTKLQMVAVFCVIRPGMRRWELMKPVPVSEYRVLGSSSPQNVICIGDRFICCVWYTGNFLLCDMADEGSPKARCVGLPLDVRRCRYGHDLGDDNYKRFRRMGAFGDSSVRFVSIHPHCCCVECYDDQPDCCGCGDSNRTECLHPRFVYTIKTWTMNLSTDEPLEWVEDGEIDSEEIWALPGYEGLPQAFPEWPVVSLDEPNVICFLVSNSEFSRYDRKEWMVQVNISRKTLLSVVELTNNNGWWYNQDNTWYMVDW